jgi:hypothetical protein
MRHIPRASASVATIGNPSGIAATASAIAASTIQERILILRQSDSADERSQDQRDPDELAGEARELLLERRDFRLGFFDELRNVTEFGAIAGGRHDADAAASRNGRALKSMEARSETRVGSTRAGLSYRRSSIPR